MTIEQLRLAHRTRPFKPFRLHLADGTSVAVRHPEMMASSEAGRTVVVNTQGDEFAIIDLLLVTKITFGGNGRQVRKGRP